MYLSLTIMLFQQEKFHEGRGVVKVNLYALALKNIELYPFTPYSLPLISNMVIDKWNIDAIRTNIILLLNYILTC